MLDLFCGVGGWSRGFLALGWKVVGVDICAFNYPGEFIKSDVLELPRDFINSFDAFCASPPCEEFARAWLPWLRGDRKPSKESLGLLRWSIALLDRPGRIVECSNFAAKHEGGSIRCDSFALWGDVPLLLPKLDRNKAQKSGLAPEKRAEIPFALSYTVAKHFERVKGGAK